MSGGGHGRSRQEVCDWSGESCLRLLQRFQFFEISTVAANPVDPMRRRVPDYETAGFYCIEISGDRTAFENKENAVPGNKKRPGIKRTSNNRK